MLHRAILDDRPPRDHFVAIVRLLFEDLTVGEDGHEVLRMADFALQSGPKLGARYLGFAATRVDGRGERGVDCRWHVGLLWMVFMVGLKIFGLVVVMQG